MSKQFNSNGNTPRNEVSFNVKRGVLSQGVSRLIGNNIEFEDIQDKDIKIEIDEPEPTPETSLVSKSKSKIL